MNYTNDFNLPQAIVSALIYNAHFSDADYSVTELINSPRILQLKKRHGDKLTSDASDEVWKFLGSHVHKLLENSDTAGIQETYVKRSFDGVTVSGTIDLIEGNILYDYKITSVWGVVNGIKDEWIAQVNMYHCLWRTLTQCSLNALKIVTILRDWVKTKAHENNYPSCQIKMFDINQWHLSDTENFILDRISQHEIAKTLLDDELPECTPYEKWQRPTTYAVKKENNKRALRVLSSKEKAETYMKDNNLDNKYWIETRPGKNVRCENYCIVNQFCNYYGQAE